MRNATDNGHFTRADAINRTAPGALQTMHSVGAYEGDFAPDSRGCISDISSDAIHGCEHDYAAAMKSYGVVYEQYQSYLLPNNQLMPHDYDLAAAPVPAFNHLGCLNEDLLDSTVHSDDVSDDEIEGCGYLGWLHH
jgi:hypothetical protein